MSPRAAWRLERLGFGDVRDFEGGKTDWLARGLDYEGSADLIGRHLDAAPTCGPDERVGDVRRRLGSGDICVVADGGLAVGVLPADADEANTVDAEMEFGVTTVRPMEETENLRARMHDHHVAVAIVTDGAGRLLGIYRP